MKVLVLAARGLQAAYVGCYGNPWIATPNLDALAAEGIVFDNHFADRADAAGARLTWRDGRHHFADTLPPGADLIEQLRQRGVHTCLILDESRPTELGFEAGWDEVHRAASFDAVLEAAADALERLAGRDAWLVWVDLTPLVPPWETPEEFVGPYFLDEPEEEMEEEVADDEPAEEEEPLSPLNDPAAGRIDPVDDVLFVRIQGSYAGAVTRLDDGLGRLLERTVALNPDDDVLIVCTTDRGQALGEHGVVGPAPPTAHEETTHLPLILRLPGADEAGRRVAGLTQAADLAPTLADVFEVELPSAQGRSLLPLVYGDAEEVRPYVCSAAEDGDVAEWSLRTPEWALLLPARPQVDDPLHGARLYVRPDDRREVNDVLQHHQELAEGLVRTLRGFVEATRRPGALEAPALPETEAGERPAEAGEK